MQDFNNHSSDSTVIMPGVHGHTPVMKNQHLHEAFVDALKEIYDAEKQLLKAQPKMEAAATSSALKECFARHIRETHHQILRLELAFESVDEPVASKTCAAMNSLIAEGQDAFQRQNPLARDAAIIAAAQKIEHYEIASYGTLKNWAQLMGHHAAASLFDQTLREEKSADRIFTQKANEESDCSSVEEAWKNA